MARLLLLSGTAAMLAMLIVMRSRAVVGSRDPVLRWAAGWTALLVASVLACEVLVAPSGAAGTVAVAVLQP